MKLLYYFDRRGPDGDRKHEERKLLNDGVQRVIDDRSDKAATEIKDFPDETDGGKIYDFSKIVLSRIDNKTKAGVVIIGMSDFIIRKEIENIKKLIMIIFLGFLVISIAGTVILATIIIRPVRKLTHGANVIGKGDLNYKIEVNTSDELGQLAEEFNTMTAMIREAREKEIETRIMNEQLEIARDIQEGLNPMGY
jgi:methyl-accepting chemotaxis protein